jgi:peptidyl-Lys metalloendopeptidase
MPTLEGRLVSSDEYQSGGAVRLRFELTNRGDEDLYVLTWYTPLEGLLSDCLRVTRGGERLPYDGPLLKRGEPTAESYRLIRAGRTVSKSFDLGSAYDLSSPGRYRVTLDATVRYFSPASSDEGLEELLAGAERRGKRQRLRGGAAQFNVVPGGGRRRMTRGEAARRRSRARRRGQAAPETGFEALGPRAPVIIGGNADRQARARQAHDNAYNLCVNALAGLANDDHYNLWFGTHTAQRFQTVGNVYARIRAGMESKTFTYDLNGGGCKSGAFAHTFPDSDTIWICERFWNAPAFGPDSQSSTLVHEHSHASADTGEHGGGQQHCQDMAQDDPDRAVRNASNYEYYAA